ncbi:MAG: magnesium transporter CorA family protein [bacterium]|nr:magnesium transporter CorA family protein [bacterium]
MPRSNHKINSLIIKGGHKKKITWLNILNAGANEIAYLRREFNFAPEDLRDATVNITALHAKVKGRENYIFLAIRFPYYSQENETINGAEIDFFIGHDLLVTLHDNKINLLKKLFDGYQKQNGKQITPIDSSVDLYYQITDKLLDWSFNLLDDMSKTIDDIEDTIFSHKSRSAVTTLLDLRRNAINFRTITKNYQMVFEKFEKLRAEAGLSDSHTPFPAVIDKTKDLWNTIENRQEMLEALYATNESILNYRLNDIMKTLTIFSVIVFPLTLLAAIFGMNTLNGMPFINHPLGFWWIIAIMLLGSFSMLLFFKRKGWM